VDTSAPVSRICAYSRAVSCRAPCAPSIDSRGSSSTSPTAVTVSAVDQNRTNAFPAARAAASGSPAPRYRDTSDAPPAPTVVETAPGTSRIGATRSTAAIADAPTPCATNHALVRA